MVAQLKKNPIWNSLKLTRPTIHLFVAFLRSLSESLTTAMAPPVTPMETGSGWPRTPPVGSDRQGRLQVPLRIRDEFRQRGRRCFDRWATRRRRSLPRPRRHLALRVSAWSTFQNQGRPARAALLSRNHPLRPACNSVPVRPFGSGMTTRSPRINCFVRMERNQLARFLIFCRNFREIRKYFSKNDTKFKKWEIFHAYPGS